MALTYSLENHIAIVTGGASGIGRATVSLLGKAGATVFLLDIDDEAGERAAKEPESHTFFLHCDLSDTAAIDQAYQEIISKVGKVDILVNNVGVWEPGGDILDMPEDTIARMEAVNVTGPRHLTRLVMSGMKQSKQEGCITFVSSTQADVIDGSPTIYNVQKNTILGMAKTFAIAGGPFGIRVNAVSPGAISTEGMGSAEAVGKERIVAGNHKTPLGRRGTPEEVAQEIVHLCFATYTTGDNRIVDGGFSKVALPVSLTVSEEIHPEDPDKNFLTQ
jgi:meso-butanediol dehydrogenase/(S,S)-butanediol dehydrogenase/diacetyl reductase